MDCFGTYFTYVQSCNVPRVQLATEWTASVHTSRVLFLILFAYSYSSVEILLAGFSCIAYWLLEHGLHYSFRHMRSIYGSSPFRSNFKTGYITALDMYWRIFFPALPDEYETLSVNYWNCRSNRQQPKQTKTHTKTNKKHKLNAPLSAPHMFSP